MTDKATTPGAIDDPKFDELLVTWQKQAPVMGQVVTEAEAWKGRYQFAAIKDDAELAFVCRCRDEAKGTERRIGEVFDPLCQLADRLHKALTGLRAKAYGPVRGEVLVYDALIVEYDARKSREAQEEADRAAALAEAQAEDAVVDEAARLEREAAATGDDSLRVLAADLIANPPPAPPPPPARRAMPPAAALNGTTVPKKWKATVADPLKFILAVARPSVYQEVIALIRQLSASAAPEVPTVPNVVALLLAKLAEMARPPAALLKIDEAGLDREATTRKFAGEIYPGVLAKQVPHVRSGSR